MKLSALLLTLVIALGLSSPLDAKTKHKTPKAQHPTTYKAPKVKKKPAKVKPMKFRKTKHSTASHSSKPAKAHKVKKPKSV
jgi:hypothetical protein